MSTDLTSPKCDAQCPPIDLGRPPPGVRFARHASGFTLEASTRNVVMAAFVIPFTIVWSGFSLGMLHVAPLLGVIGGLGDLRHSVPAGVDRPGLAMRHEPRRRGTRGGPRL